MPHHRATALMLGLCLLVSGCGLRHPEQVESLAAEAASDPRKIGKLVASLRSKHEDVRLAAQDALLELGAAAVPELREVILRKRSEAGPALLVLGRMGDPQQFPLIEQHLDDPTLGPWAKDGLQAGEEALWGRISVEPSLPLCDAYLDWFPDGDHHPFVIHLRREIEAERALEAMGASPRYGALVSYHRRYGDTGSGERARLMHTERALQDAQDEIIKGRPRQALRYVEEAREWDSEADANPIEAAARVSWAQSLTDSEQWTQAIEQLTLAGELGGGSPALLGDLYMTRAQTHFLKGDPVEGMTDLWLAERTFEPLALPAQVERTRQGRKLMGAMEREEVPIRQGIQGLAMAGPELVEDTRSVVWTRLMSGDPDPLQFLVQAASAPVISQPAGAWLDTLVDRALTETQGQVSKLLEDVERHHALLDPLVLWTVAGDSNRKGALALLHAYEGAIRAARAHVRFGRTVTGPLPETPLEGSVALRERISKGADPQDTDLSPLVRAQLTRFSLEQVEVLRDLSWRHPALLASRFVGREVLPVSLAEWALFSSVTQEERRQSVYKVTLRDGKTADLTVQVQEGAMRVEMSLFGPSIPLDDAAMIDGLTVLFGTARPLLFVHSDVTHVDVVMGMNLSDGTLDQRLRLGLDQRTAQRMNWSLIEAEAPYSTDHLALVLDQEIR